MSLRKKTLPLEPEKINRLLGTDISKEDMVKYLNRLEIPVEGDTILVPSFRPDLNLMADIAEEVGRSLWLQRDSHHRFQDLHAWAAIPP